MNLAVPDKKGASVYRYDLDGLRGFAIALVVFFHVFVGRVSGGVDVFLLLSGYFFLGSQVRYALRPNPSLNPFWPFWRTARRLVPALAVVLVAALLGVMFFVPELMTTELVNQFVASILYCQNWMLSRQDAAYAAAGVETSPLQHLWSMSVQGQFYFCAIVLGLIIAIAVSKLRVDAQKARSVTIGVLTVITIASFLYASRFGIVGTPSNYYSIFSRMWEMTLGGILALIPRGITLPQRYSAAATGLGMVMIAITGVIIPTSLAFPGPLTLLPLTGAMLVILSSPTNAVSQLLSSPPFQWLGKSAYSLYLWHWPLLIISTAVGGYDTPPVWLGVAVITASLVLAHLTHTFVEEPLRQHGPRPRAMDKPVSNARESLRTPAGRGRLAGGIAVSLLVVSTLAVKPYWGGQIDDAAKPLDPATHPGARVLLGAEAPDVEALPDPDLIAGIFPPIGDGCMVYLPEGPEDFVSDECVYGDREAETTVVLAGGSHVEPLGIPLDELGQQHGFKVIPYVRQECPIMLGDFEDDTVSDVCREWSINAFDRIIELDPDLVISTSTRPAGHAGAAVMTQDMVPDGYLGFWEALRENNIPFLGLRDNPWIFDGAGDPMDPNYCLSAGEAFEDCSMPRELVYEPVDPASEYLDGTDGMFSVDSSDWYCIGDTCPPAIGNVYIYRDQNHLSNAYSESLAPVMWEVIKPILDELRVPHT
ncbi:O-acetyltransferase OatA [Corynebacterium glaucum]|uniref:acyltransferase family protein n=1 Tax=Corynebacterium glaucum TaxID=187491 RepID=UPI0025B5BF6F|nr:acyltransferase family protein [Corynebacterium glaucum]WJZ08054.1 O-acetyltransferase OatA [Corynebacterium glaucum]